MCTYDGYVSSWMFRILNGLLMNGVGLEQFWWVYAARSIMARPKEVCLTSPARDQKLAYILISRSTYILRLTATRSTYILRSTGRAVVRGCSVLFDNIKSVHGHSFICSPGFKAYIRLLYILVHRVWKDHLRIFCF